MRHKFIFAVIAAATVLACCNKEEKNTLPGLWLEESIIATFPTDEVSVVGTASNYVGISTISLVCENWAVEHVYDLSSQKPEVFNFDCRFIVPETAEFSDDMMTVTVTDINGLQTSKEIVFEFLPDNEAPTAEPALPEQTSVEFDASASTGGTWELDLELYDRRGLGRAVISVPDATINETVQIEGATEYRLQKTYQISSGTYTAIVTVYDLAGNRTAMETSLVVMPVEDEDPVEDYSQMFIVNAAEDPDDYLDGYYIHMDKAWANGAEVPYTYQGEFYAPAGMELYIVPEESMEGDMFGVSPYVSSKLMNKKGYVKPVPVPGEGYQSVRNRIHRCRGLELGSMGGTGRGHIYLHIHGAGKFWQCIILFLYRRLGQSIPLRCQWILVGRSGRRKRSLIQLRIQRKRSLHFGRRASIRYCQEK